MEIQVKNIKGICILTQDVQRLREFYQDVLQAEAQGDETFAAFVPEGTQLSLCHAAVMEQMAPNSMAGTGHGCYTLEVEVDDVDREYERLTELRVPIVKPPTTQAWGLRSVWFRDPDGNLINFYARVEKSRKENQ